MIYIWIAKIESVSKRQTTFLGLKGRINQEISFDTLTIEITIIKKRLRDLKCPVGIKISGERLIGD